MRTIARRFWHWLRGLFRARPVAASPRARAPRYIRRHLPQALTDTRRGRRARARAIRLAHRAGG